MTMYAKGEYTRAFHEVVKIAPVTLPKLNLGDLDTKAIEAETREAQSRVRVIRGGRDAWEQIAKAQSFEAWAYRIGPALAIGKAHALKVTGANAAWGRAYSREFGIWMKRYGFSTIPKSTRSMAIELAENIDAIEQWRSTLPEKQRKRLVHPFSVTRRWKTAVQAKEQAVTDTRKAVAAWSRFVTHAKALTPEQALPLWQAAQAQASEALCR